MLGGGLAAAAAAARAALVAAAAFAEPSAKDAVDGVTVGPVSRSHPLAQPVAAGPVKVGVKTPRLDVVTADLAVFAVVAVFAVLADAPPGAASSAIGSASMNKPAHSRCRVFFLVSCILVSRLSQSLLAPRGSVRARDTRCLPHPGVLVREHRVFAGKYSCGYMVLEIC